MLQPVQPQQYPVAMTNTLYKNWCTYVHCDSYTECIMYTMYFVGFFSKINVSHSQVGCVGCKCTPQTFPKSAKNNSNTFSVNRFAVLQRCGSRFNFPDIWNGNPSGCHSHELICNNVHVDLFNSMIEMESSDCFLNLHMFTSHWIDDSI